MGQKINWAAMPRMLDLTNIFERIVDCFNQRPLSQQDFILPFHQAAFHVFTQMGDEFNSFAQQFFKQRLADITLVAKELSE